MTSMSMTLRHGARIMRRAATAAGLIVCSVSAFAARPAAADASASGATHARSAASASGATHARSAASAPARAHVAMPAGQRASSAATAAKKAPAPAALVDVNSASKAQLKTLPGIGDAEAERIIANRPYLTKAHLVSKNAIPAGLYFSLKRSVIALPPTSPATKK